MYTGQSSLSRPASVLTLGRETTRTGRGNPPNPNRCQPGRSRFLKAAPLCPLTQDTAGYAIRFSLVRPPKQIRLACSRPRIKDPHPGTPAVAASGRRSAPPREHRFRRRFPVWSRRWRTGRRIGDAGPEGPTRRMPLSAHRNNPFSRPKSWIGPVPTAPSRCLYVPEGTLPTSENSL